MVRTFQFHLKIWPSLKKNLIGLWIALSLLPLGGCALRAEKPCTAGFLPGQSPWENRTPTLGKKKCQQIQTRQGYVNDGTFGEWHPDGKPAIAGEYRLGNRVGKWKYWDEKGTLLAERWFTDGVETPNREAQVKDGVTAASPGPSAQPPKPTLMSPSPAPSSAP